MKTIITILLLLISSIVFAQNSRYWHDMKSTDLPVENVIEYSGTIEKALYFTLDKENIINVLENSPDRFSNSSSTVSVNIPSPIGGYDSFEVYTTPTIARELAENLPEVRSYIGYNITDRNHRLRITITPMGFYAMTTGSEEGQTFINPYARNSNAYVLFNKSQITKTALSTFSCEVTESDSFDDLSPQAASRFIDDGVLRRYQLGVATTVEYSDFQWQAAGVSAGAPDSDKKDAVQAAIVVTIDRVNEIYERDLGVTLQLIPNNKDVIYLGNASSDPYTNNNGGAMLSENQTVFTNVIGSANYDIGHVFSTGGGGVASLNSVCKFFKARGVTGQGSPVGDPFDIDYVAHEIGHQFGANHTQNNNCNRVSSAAMEPGSANTIMGYAGICSPNTQSNSDAMFHYISISEISNSFVNNGTGGCAVNINIANTAPVVQPLPNYIIPRNTPFRLEANATDVNGDNLTYSWEQIDNEIAPMPPVSSATGGPSFRTFLPSTSPIRYFPGLPTLLNNNYSNTWEVLPNVNRDLNFAVVVRDNNTLGGQVSIQTNTLTVDDSAGPFRVTSQNTTGDVWLAGTTETITWDVANTNSGSVNAQEVDIYLSLDGGLTYTTILLQNTPNDGTENLVVPDIETSNARLMVKASNNVFFDINQEVFSIEGLVYCDAGPTLSLDSEIENVTLIGENNSIQNNTTNNCTGSTGGEISDFTNQSADLFEGGSYTLSVEFGDCDGAPQFDGAGGIWIDWNNDGDFNDLNEEIGKVDVGVSSGNVIQDFTINVLPTQTLGNYRMRIVQEQGVSASTVNPCLVFDYGAVEDYTVEIIEAPNPTITLSETNISGLEYTLNSGPSTEQSFVVQGEDLSNDAIITSPVNFEISLSPGSGFAGSLSLTPTGGELSATTIYVRLVSGLGEGTYSGSLTAESLGAPQQIINLSGAVLPFSYCDAGPTSNIDSEIENVVLNGETTSINNNTTNICTGSLGGEISNFTNLSADLLPDTNYILSVEFGDCDGGGQFDGAGGVWIDWNLDGDFQDANEEIGTVDVAVSNGNVTEDFTINVPPTQSQGNYRMRIVQEEQATSAEVNPCGTFTWGAVEDYTINIGENPCTVFEDFESGLPAGWSTVVNTGTCDWVNQSALPTGDDFPTLAMVFDDDACGDGAPASNVSLLSDVYDTTGASSILIDYDVSFQEIGAGETLTVEVWDGAAWQQIAFYDADLNPDIQTEVDIDATAFANSNFQVRWTYDDAAGAWAWHAGVDNFCMGLVFNNWEGTVSTDWDTPANWSLGAVPTSVDSAVITDVPNQPLIDDTTIAEVDNLILNSNTTVNVEGVLKVSGDITNDGKMVFKSSELSGSGQLDEFTGTITGSGEVTVERYIPARRAFRFLASPVTTTDFIYENWQESGSTPVLPDGLGTHITGGSITDGFDQSGSNNPSMFTFDIGTQNWEALANTNATQLIAGNAYLTMVRGDRTIDLTITDTDLKETTLRATGELFTGPISSILTAQAGLFSLVGNPYQAIVDINNLDFSNVNENVYWVWDPNLGSRGNYVAVMLPGGLNTTTSTANQFIQPGQSFFVQTIADGPAGLTFNENDKTVSGDATAVFSQDIEASLKLLLYTSAAYNSGERETDGMLINFSENGNNGLNLFDADKLQGPDENLARLQGNALISLEQRAMPANEELLQLSVTGYTAEQYTFVVNASNIDTNFEAYLQDNYTGTLTRLNEGSNAISFSVDANILESIAEDRFSLVFDNTTLAVDDNTFGANFSLYPNPSNNGQFSIRTPNLFGEVRVTLVNMLGQKILREDLTIEGNEVNVNAGQLSDGVYIVKLAKDKQTFITKLIVEN